MSHPSSRPARTIAAATNAEQTLPTPPRVLLEAAIQFSDWIRTNVPGAVVILCGGLALVQYGSLRTTQDADLCIDLSRTRRVNSEAPFDTNALKDLARNDPNLIVGPKIFWIHQPSGIKVQVDFVDAQLFWRPFDVRYAVDFSTPIPCLSLPTLLVGKMKSALERNDPDVYKAEAKKINDVKDFDFALQHCLQRHQHLTEMHLKHLAEDSQLLAEVVRDFVGLRMETSERGDTSEGSWVDQWNTLVRNSGLPSPWDTAAMVAAPPGSPIA